MRVSTIAWMLAASALGFAADESKPDLKANDRRIDYIEFHSNDLAKTKAFYTEVFGWKFTDYGPDYTSFDDGRLTGGFWKEGSASGGPLVILYAVDLAATEARIRAAGGAIVKPAFAFPGGRRFHFTDPSGNMLAVWSDK
jgi:predicted enzyme related to lactoylglutathione lyase